MPDAEPSGSAHTYEVLGKLAEGGLTEIFLARAKGAGAVERFVVLKRLKRLVTSQVDLVKQFLDEARLVAQLQHPNVAQVFEVGKLGGSYFFAMEFVNGETLQALMSHARARQIQVPVRAVLTIAAAMAAGLHHAHERRGTAGEPLHIVHGDVSPSNTLVSQEGIVKLIDFGVERAGEHGDTKIGPYSSPEQCHGRPRDRRSDLFSLGVVLWELLTLQSLYHRATDEEVVAAIDTEEPAKPSTHRYDVPPELDAIVLRLLAKNPDDRFRDADEVLAEIEALAQKLNMLLSTADLSRMMRLWFGAKSEPSSEEAALPVTPVVVNSEEIPDDLAIPVESPIDQQLDAVRDAAALIAVRALARSSSPSGRQGTPSVPPELMEHPHESFEQLRDRILARARQKRETARNQLLDALTGDPAGSGDASAARAVPVELASTTTRPANTNDRHTRATTPAPISLIEAAVRRAELVEPGDTAPAQTANGRSASTEETAPADATDKVVVDVEAVAADGANGGTNGVKSVSGASGTNSEGGANGERGAAREAPPVSANVASATAPAAPAKATDAAEPASASASRGKLTTRDSGRATTASGEIERVDKPRSPTADADERADREEKARREEAAYARASTAEIARRAPSRPAWIAPVLGVGTLAVVVLVVAMLRAGNDQAGRAHAKGSQVSAQHVDTSASASEESPRGPAPSPTPAESAPTLETQAATTPTPSPTPAESAPAPSTPSEPAPTRDEPATAPATSTHAASTDTAAPAPAQPDTPSPTPASAESVATQSARAPQPDAAPAQTSSDPQPAKKNVAGKERGKRPVESPAPAKGIEELFTAGELDKTNTACTNELVFTPAKLEVCALAACETKQAALAKRWIKAIAKASRPRFIEVCRTHGVEIEDL